MAKGAPTLWINSKRRAWSFFLATIVVALAVFGLENVPAWKFLAYADPQPSADDWERASAHVVQAMSTHADVVLFVGGSTARELTGPDAFISRDLSSACGRPILFVNAGTASQNVVESWSLVNAVPPNRLSLAVVSMNYFRFEQSPSDNADTITRRRIIFEAPYIRTLSSQNTLTAISDILVPHYLAWLTGHASAFRWRLTKRSYTEIAMPNGNPYHGQGNSYPETPLPLQQKEQIASTYLAERIAPFFKNRKGNLDLWKQLVGQEHREGIRMLFLAVPESSAMAHVDVVMGPPFAESLSELQATGAMVVDWRHSLELSESDFYDQQHLLDAGRRDIGARFVKLIVSNLPHCTRASE